MMELTDREVNAILRENIALITELNDNLQQRIDKLESENAELRKHHNHQPEDIVVREDLIMKFVAGEVDQHESVDYFCRVCGKHISEQEYAAISKRYVDDIDDDSIPF